MFALLIAMRIIFCCPEYDLRTPDGTTTISKHYFDSLVSGGFCTVVLHEESKIICGWFPPDWDARKKRAIHERT